ncbi:MAG: T9SS type A sorting domain-containing protein [Candidatus Caldipriscus sp.]
MKRIGLLLSLLIAWGVGGLYSQTYSPNDPDWRQGRHDYKKTARAPWRCNTPMSVSKQWDIRDPNDSDIFVTTADINGDGVAEIFHTGGVRLFSDGAPNVWLNIYGSRICNSTFWADEATGECVIGANGVLCPLTEMDAWGNEDGYFTKGNFSCGEVYRRRESEYYSNLTIADVNGDGNPEVFRGVNTWAVSVNGNAGSYTENWAVNMGTGVGTPVLGDFDGDGVLEVCFPLTNNTINCRNAINGAFKWSWSMPCGFITLRGLPSWLTQAVMAEDLDGDGRDELVALGSSCVAAFKYGVGLWWVNSSYGASTAGAIGRLNSDPYPDVVFKSGSNYVVLNGINGSLIATFSDATQGCSAPTIADITGDGINDVIIACTNPVAYSASNGWSGRVWTGTGAAPYRITSDIVVARRTNTSLMIVFGDASCFTTLWSCPVAVMDYDDITNVEEGKVLESLRVEGGKGYILIKGYSGNVEIYNTSGRLIKSAKVEGEGRFDLPSGAYMVKLGKDSRVVIVR